MTFALTSPGGWGSDAIKQAGGHAAPRRVPARCPEAKAGGTSPLPHAGHENPEADTHVESHDDVLSDAGSTPAASTILHSLRSLAQSGVGAGVRLSGIALRARPSRATPAASTILLRLREFTRESGPSHSFPDRAV